MKLKKKYSHNNKRQIFRLIPTDTGKIIIENVKMRHALFSSFIPGILIFLFCGIKGIFIFFIVLIAVILFVSYMKKKIGGMTGDTLGALNEVSELIVLLSFLII